MAEFDSLRSYKQFEDSVKSRARFVHEDAVQRFLETVLATAEGLKTRLAEGRILYRAQTGFVPATETLTVPVLDNAGEVIDEEVVEVDAKAPLSPERMIPKAEFVGDGRVNPRGIPCLYLATTASAAISEMRPWVGSLITIAQFKIIRDCRLVDCSRYTTESWLLRDVDPEKAKTEPDARTREKGVWGDIGFAFSKPVARGEPHLDYIPTQILAEAFRSHGYHGIVYRSLLDKGGKNIALFDVQAASPTSCCLYQTRSASLKCEKVEPFDARTTWPALISSDLEPVAFIDGLDIPEA